MTEARLGLAIDSGGAQRAAVDLDKFTGAATRAEASALKLVRTSTEFSRRITEGMSGFGAPALANLQASERLLIGMGAAGSGAGNAIAKGAALGNTQMMALQHSARSMVEQLALGVPVTQALAGQMNHLTYVMSGPGGVTGAAKAIGSAIAGFLVTPLGQVAAVAALTGAAVGAIFINERSHAKAAEDALKRHIDLIGRIKDAYKDATDASTRYGAESTRILQTLDAEQRRIAQEQLSKQASQLQIPGSGGLGVLSTLAVGEEARKAVMDFNEAGKKGQDDWKKFGEALDKAFHNPAINAGQREVIRGLEEMAAAGSKTQLSLRAIGQALPGPMTPNVPTQNDSLIEILKQRAEVERIRRGMIGDLTAISAKSPGEVGANAALRERISLTGEAISAEEREARITAAGTLARAQAEFALSEAQRQRLQVGRDALEAAQLDVDLVGKGIAQTTELRANWSAYADLRREAEDNNIAFDDAQYERLKKINAEIARRVELEARTQLRSDLSFERSQMGRSDTEQRVADQMREIYGDDFLSHMHDFEAQQIRINERLKELDDIGRDVTKGALHDFFDGLREGQGAFESLETAGLNALTKIENKLIDMVADQAWNSIFGAIAGALGGSVLPGGAALGQGGIGANALGNAFSGGNVIPFRQGGIVNRPTLFPMARGMGLMGEAGPEAVMPLRRGPDGKLGVAAQGGSTVIREETHYHDHVGVKIEKQTQRDPLGNVRHDVMIKGMVGAAIADPAVRRNAGLPLSIKRR